MVEHIGLEPITSCVQSRCSPSCANAPKYGNFLRREVYQPRIDGCVFLAMTLAETPLKFRDLSFAAFPIESSGSSRPDTSQCNSGLHNPPFSNRK